MQGNISKTNGSGVVLPEDVLKEAKTAANEASASAKSALSSALSAEAAAERSEAAASNAENAASEVVSAYISNVPTRNLANVVFENAVLSQTGDFVARTDGLRFASSPDFIKVDGGETYTFSFITNVASGASLNMFEYDADKKYLRNTIVGGLFSSPRTIAVGNDCRYIRLTSFTNKAGEPWENCIPQKFQ
ncbi:MAG: hypothetical protein IKK94_03875, partial [Clostridia bacterium]|nr:hypothetical protein [Clostridia bacterium]